MKQLNYNHEVGEVLYIGNWSWQVSEIKGFYRIIERNYKEEYYLLEGTEFPYKKILVDMKTMAYFTGEQMPTQEKNNL